MNYEDMGFLFPYIRFFNASPQGGSLDFYVGNTLVAAGIKFGSFTDYIKTSTAPTIFKATRAGIKTEKVCDITYTQKTGNVATLCVAGKPDKCEFAIMEEPTLKTNMEYGHIRICNLCPEEDAFDILANDKMILGDIGFKEISKYMEIQPNEYEIKLITTEKKVLNCGHFSFRPSKFNTLYILGLKNEIPLISIKMTKDAGSYSGFYL